MLAVEGAPVNPVSGEIADNFTLTSRYRGEAPFTDSFGRDFTAHHFSVISVGTSGRNARAEHVQGAFIINATGEKPFRPL
jgi:hypothetical protein